jgi:hypothetical protein
LVAELQPDQPDLLLTQILAKVQHQVSLLLLQLAVVVVLVVINIVLLQQIRAQ